MKHEECAMSHEAERYLLGEMDEGERDLYEAHFFDCPVCAQDVKLAEIFKANARSVFLDRAPVIDFKPRTGIWDWLRIQPLRTAAAALVIAAFSLTTYQNVVVIPELRSRIAQSEAPRAYPVLRLTAATRGELPLQEISAETREVGISIDLFPEWDFAKYLVELSTEQGTIWSLELDSPPPGVPLQVLVPASRFDGRRQNLLLYGVGADSRNQLDSFAFEISKK